MAKQKFVWRNGTFVDITNGDPANLKKEVHSVIQDSMDGLLHPLTREVIDSKSKFNRTTIDNGGTCIGNEDVGKIQEVVEKNKPRATGVGQVIAKNWEILEQCPSEIPSERREEWFRDVTKERG